MWLMKRYATQGWTFSILAWSLTSLTGCGSKPATQPSSSIASGNWSIVATSTNASNQIFTVGGSIAQNGASLSGKVHVLAPCEAPNASDPNQSVLIKGTVSGDVFELQAGPTAAGTMLTFVLSGKGESLQSLKGTFTESDDCGLADQGTVTAVLVPSASGTWAAPGTPSAGHSGVIVWLGLKQDPTPNEFGAYNLNGVVTYINASCEADSVPIFGYLAGSILSVGVDTSSTNPVDFYATGSFAPPNISTFAGEYQTKDGGTLPACAGDKGSITFELQTN
jgi:hypothetical protein